MEEKYLYEEGDFVIGESQCDFCLNYSQQNKTCALMTTIPLSIIKTEERCDFFTYQAE